MGWVSRVPKAAPMLAEAWVLQTWRSTGTEYTPVPGTHMVLAAYQTNHIHFYLVVSS